MNANTFFQSHTGVSMANAFQDMLKRFGLTKKILAVNADNATSNDTQTTTLHKLDNTFDEANRVRCFNHTIQLSAKSLLKPFNAALSRTPVDDVAAFDDNNDETIGEGDEAEEGQDEDDEDQSEDKGGDEDSIVDKVEDDNIDELQELSEQERLELLEETQAVRSAVTKV